MSLRIHLYGNVCNGPYAIAKFLRRAGVDAHLFLERNFPWRPEIQDPELTETGYPPWIHLTGDLRGRRYGVLDGSFVRRLGACDVVHVAYYGPIWAAQTGRPFVFQAYGGDLTALPFMTDSLHHRYLAWRQRRAIPRANVVVVGNPNLCRTATARLRLERVEFLHYPIDADRFAPGPDAEAAAIRRTFGEDWVFFHPTRQSWGPRCPVWDAKGNDSVFRGFARFLRGTGRRARLVSIEHGNHLGASRRLVSELGIGDAVTWIPRQSQHGLIPFYRMADAVIEDMRSGDFGTIASEAWACGTPVFMYLASCRALFTEDPPVVNVRTEDDLARTLAEYTAAAGALARVGDASRRWVLEHLHGDILIKRYVDLYERVLGGRRLWQDREE